MTAPRLASECSRAQSLSSRLMAPVHAVNADEVVAALASRATLAELEERLRSARLAVLKESELTREALAVGER